MADGGHITTIGLLVDAHIESGQVTAAAVVVDAHVESGSVATLATLVDATPKPLGLVSAEGILLDALCTFCVEGGVSTIGILVDAFERELYDVRAVNAKVEDIFERVRTEEVRVRDIVDAGEVPETDLRGYLVAVTGFRAEIKACRVILDARDVLDALVYFDAADAIRLWKWERELRSALVTVDRQLRVSQEITTELIDNRPGRTYVTRTGDTLQSLAVRFFGSPEDWRRITDANPELTIGELVAGTVINIPEGE